EAHVHEDRISRLIDEAHVAVEANNHVGLEGLRYEILPVNIEDELKQSYLDYAMTVIIGRALPDSEAVKTLPAVAINRLQLAALTFMSLSKAAEIACNRIPLFAYGPELSEFRHRLR
uniref:Carboxyvinyl-carboxyphosphonate phosphorylmutase n=1 Tax=Steinernema glaseri TaxID=37863 RepID=A0A1I8ANV1_9BILA